MDLEKLRQARDIFDRFDDGHLRVFIYKDITYKVDNKGVQVLVNNHWQEPTPHDMENLEPLLAQI